MLSLMIVLWPLMWFVEMVRKSNPMSAGSHLPSGAQVAADLEQEHAFHVTPIEGLESLGDPRF